MFWFDLAYRIIKVFRDGATPAQIAWGLTLGFMMGIIPGWPLHVFVLLLIALIFNVNLTMVGLGAIVTSLLTLALDPVLDTFGYYILSDIPALTGLFTHMYNSTFWMLTRFNNSLVMGGTALGILLAIPLFLVFRQLVILIRSKVIYKLGDTKLAKWIRKSWIYGIYSRINAVGSRI